MQWHRCFTRLVFLTRAGNEFVYLGFNWVISVSIKGTPEGKNFADRVTMTKQKKTSSQTGIFAYIWDLVTHRQWLWWKSSQTWSGLAGRAMKFLAIPAFRGVHRKWRSQPIYNTTGVPPFIGNKKTYIYICILSMQTLLWQILLTGDIKIWTQYGVVTFLTDVLKFSGSCNEVKKSCNLNQRPVNRDYLLNKRK